MSGNCIHEGVTVAALLAYLEAYRGFFGLGRLS